MSPLLLILILLLIFSMGGGALRWGEPIGYGGVSVGFVLLIVLLVLLFGGRL